MTTQHTQCECRDEVLNKAFFIVAVFIGLALMIVTNFPDLMGEIPGRVQTDGMVATWEWLSQSVCRVDVDDGRYVCPGDGEGGLLTALLFAGFYLLAFVWLATLRPLRRLKLIAAGLKTLGSTLKKKLHPKQG